MLDGLFLLRLLLTTFLLFKVEVIVKYLARSGLVATLRFFWLLAADNRGGPELELVFNDLELLAYFLSDALAIVRLFVVTLLNRLLHQER